MREGEIRKKDDEWIVERVYRIALEWSFFRTTITL